MIRYDPQAGDAVRRILETADGGIRPMAKKHKALKAGEKRTYTSKTGAVFELVKVKDGAAKKKAGTKKRAKQTTTAKATKPARSKRSGKASSKPAKRASSGKTAGKKRKGSTASAQQLALLG